MKRQGNAAGPQPVDESFALITVRCLDEALDDGTFDGFMKIAQSVTGEDPNQLLFASGNWNNNLLCVGWPYAGRQKFRMPNKNEMMWVTADFDENTPTEQATLAITDTPNAVLVVRHGDDHGTINQISNFEQPARDIEVEYVKTGKLPSAEAKELVTVVGPGQPRPAIELPYAAPIGLAAADVDAANTNNPDTSSSSSSSSSSSDIKDEVKTDTNKAKNWFQGLKTWQKGALIGGVVLVALLLLLTIWKCCASCCGSRKQGQKYFPVGHVAPQVQQTGGYGGTYQPPPKY